MAVGLEVYNETNKVQITSEYSNMVLRSKKRKVDQNAFTTEGLFFAIQPDIGEDNPVSSLNPNLYRRQVHRELQKRRNWCSAYADAGSSLGNMTIYSFDIPTVADLTATENLGLEVYKADGSVAYNSNLKYMKVLASSKSHTGTSIPVKDEMGGIFNYYGSEVTLNFGHPNVAVIFTMSYHVDQIDTDGWYILASAVRMKTNYDLIIADFISILRTGFKGAISTECSWLVVDVTGL